MIPINLWLHIILSTLNQFSDRNYQYENWVMASNPKIFDSYNESMCNLFDEGAVRAFLKDHTQEAGFTKEQTLALKKVVDSIDQYDGFKMMPEELLKDPKWIAITEEVRRALKILPKDNYVEDEGR